MVFRPGSLEQSSARPFEPLRNLLNPSDNREALGQRITAARGRIQARRGITHELLDGKMTLRKAAELFRDVSEIDPFFDWGYFRRYHPGTSAEECHCRYVIAYARNELVNQPLRATFAIAALEAELEGYLRDGFRKQGQRLP
jgi:hypothetical protein